ncbi:MAG: hypothetical protein IFK93_04600 [Acidobacteria bacterium]|nr:hypothetical protein [Candidatus Sulfomarinibacter kjeldsenii]MBD3856534.1 hypothetical protein [Candidatus Sulfomarinibacter kjeldsenii]
MNDRKWTGPLVVAILILAVTSTAVAHDEDDPQVNRVLGDKFSVRLIGGLVDLNSDVAAGSSLGALIDLEEILGFDEQIATFGLEGFWRFSKNRKHALRLRYGNFDRDAYAAVEGTVPILDVDFFGEISSSFTNQVTVVEYQYSFINHHKTEAGITAGFAIYNYGLELAGQIAIGDDPDQSRFRREKVGVIAPVPAVGFYINQAFRQNLILEIRTSFIDLEIGEHNGRIFTTWGSVTWYFARHWGVGVGLTGSDVVYDKSGGKERIKVELRQSAVTFNVTAVF